MDNDNENLQPEKCSQYSIKIGENLYRRIDKLILLLKHLDVHSRSKQGWIIEAIKEKLETEEQLPPDDLPRERHLGIKLGNRLKQRLDKRVDLHKKFRQSYSIKQWMLEALYEKLDRDEREFRGLVEQLSCD